MPMWSKPRRIVERVLNSYKLETLEGLPLEGEYHARRLRRFTPREGTELAAQQKNVEAGEATEAEWDDENEELPGPESGRQDSDLDTQGA